MTKSEKKILPLLILSFIGSVFYRLGGIGAPFNTKVRDLGVPSVACLLLWMWGYTHFWSLFWTFGLMFIAQTSYFKRKHDPHRLWGWFEWNWVLVGLAFSLAVIPISIYVQYWHGFLYRSLIVTVFTWAWSQFVGKDWLEEGGRGFIQVITLSLLLT